MRRFLAFAALMLGLASCQTEPQFDVQMGGEQEVMLTVSLPEATRASSAQGFDLSTLNTTNSGYTLRYILEVYRFEVGENDSITVLTDHCQHFVKAADATSMVFPVRLAPGYNYRIVAWADIVLDDGKMEDRCYNALNGLANISIVEDMWKPMDETRDAFTGVKDITNFSSTSDLDMTLTRPFAKLRVVATDIDDICKVGLEPTSAVAEYLQNMYVKYNAVEDKCIADDAKMKKHEYTYADTASKYEDDDDVEYTLFADYIFVPSTGTAKFNLTVNATAGVIKENNFNTDIPVKHNCLTTISGNILTYGNDISVNIEESEKDFASEYIYIEGDFTLTENMVIDRPLAVRAGAKAVINLNGHDIINTTQSETFGEGEGIIAYGNLTIKGNGTVQGSTMAVWARGNAGAVVNIYGGNFLGCEEGFAKGGRSVIYASSDNTVNIYGGTFEASAADKTSYADKTNGVYAALNVQDNHGTINVYGGTFKNFNPAVPGTEPASWMQTHPNGFVANGYKSRNVEGSMTDYEVYDTTILVEQANLNEILANLNKPTTETEVLLKLSEDLIPEKTIDVPAGKNVHLDLNGQTITIDPETLTPNGNGSHYAFIIREGGSLTIDGNGTVEATTPAPFIFYPAGDLVIESGTFVRNIPEGYEGSAGSMFVGTKPTGGWGSAGVTINGGYFDSGYYDSYAADVEELLADTKVLEETADDIKKRGQAGDANKVRKALKENCSKLFNKSNNYFRVYGGTFVGANPAWGDEGCMLPTTPQYLRPWSYYQGAFLVGQTFHEDGIVLPEGYEITKSNHEDGRPIYTVTYNK